MISGVSPTIHYEHLARIYARSATTGYANPAMSAVWSQDPGPDNPLAASTLSGEARLPEERFVAPISSASDAFVPPIEVHTVDVLA